MGEVKEEKKPFGPPRLVVIEYESGEKTTFDCQGEDNFVVLTSQTGIFNGDLIACLAMLQAGTQLIINHLQRGEKEVSH